MRITVLPSSPIVALIWTQRFMIASSRDSFLHADRSSQLKDLSETPIGEVIAMPAEIVIRVARPSEDEPIQTLVQTIADETFAYLFPSSQVPIGKSDWSSSWVAISGEVIVGVTMTRDEWVSDLWVRRENRASGVGVKLLAHAEREIRDRGHDTIRLRVVKSNTRAVDFYQHHGWRVRRQFPHEKFDHMMLEMTKSSGTLPMP